MPGFSIQIISDTVTPKLLKASALIKQAITNELEAAGAEMEATARRIVPVRTGYLQSTIYHKTDPNDLSLELGAKADYALYVEMGTRRMAAEPFLRPAWDAGEQKLLDSILFGIMWAFQ
ncbi:MAG: HK97-gp10 family putative phage morphogenesis protein [Candidatus Bathyarchaeia archaeon]